MFIMSRDRLKIMLFCLVLLSCVPSLVCGTETSSGKDYVIGPEDMLQIKVWGNDDLNREVEVSQEGAFTFPLIDKVQAAGLSVFELERVMRARLSEGFFVKPQVTITVTKQKIQRIYVTGEVNKPGDFKWEKGMTVHQAVALAGGPTRRGAPNRTSIMRTESGGEKEIKPDLGDTVLPNDIIKVPQSYF